MHDISYTCSWVIESSLDKLKFARQKTAYCYFSAAATLFSPELSDARMAWAKNGILTTVVDDFFDVGGSIEELLNLIQLVEKYPSPLYYLNQHNLLQFHCILSVVFIETKVVVQFT